MKYFSSFLVRFVILQATLVAGLVALYFANVLQKPFSGDSKYFTIFLTMFTGWALVRLWRKDFENAEWIAVRLMRIAILGMLIGCIGALTSVSAGMLGGEEQLTVMGLFMGHIGVAFYVSLVAVASNLWLDLNIKLLGGESNEAE